MIYYVHSVEGSPRSTKTERSTGGTGSTNGYLRESDRGRKRRVQPPPLVKLEAWSQQ